VSRCPVLDYIADGLLFGAVIVCALAVLYLAWFLWGVSRIAE
jgi:hypothetical protein